MKPRKMRPKKVPAVDPQRALRFYRELFDFAINSQQELVVDQQTIEFYLDNQKTEIEILVRDYQVDIEKHLKNYFVAIENIQYLKKNKVTYTVKDSEGNTVYIEGNRS